MPQEHVSVQMVDNVPPPKSHPGHAAFVLCELEWMRKRLVARLACDELASFGQQLGSGPGSFSEGPLRRLVADVDELQEQLVSVAWGLSNIPMREIQATPDEIAEAAAASLADGIADGERALHAARWIAPGPGMRALVTSLRQNDAHLFWEVKPLRFVAAFRAVDPRLADAVCREAHVADETFAELDDALIADLADALLRFADSYE